MFPFVGFIIVGLSIPMQQKPHFCINFEVLRVLGSASAIEPVKTVSVYRTPQLRLYQCTWPPPMKLVISHSCQSALGTEIAACDWFGWFFVCLFVCKWLYFPLKTPLNCVCLRGSGGVVFSYPGVKDVNVWNDCLAVENTFVPFKAPSCHTPLSKLLPWLNSGNVAKENVRKDTKSSCHFLKMATHNNFNHHNFSSSSTTVFNKYQNNQQGLKFSKLHISQIPKVNLRLILWEKIA